MYILGISGGFRHGYQDASACLVREGEIVFAAEEERFSRVKQSPGKMPLLAMRAALAHAGINLQDVAALAWAATWPGAEERLRDFVRHHFGHCPPVRLIHHHVAHAASAYDLSGFEAAGILTMDLSGDSVSTMLSHGRRDELRVLASIERPNSLGLFYTVLTQVLGFRAQADEYKVMGLAAFGKPIVDLDWLLAVGHTSYRLDLDHVYRPPPGQPFPTTQEAYYSDHLRLRIEPRLPGEPITRGHEDLAASTQRQLERAALAMVARLEEMVAASDLCLAGGVALNCAMNERLRGAPGVRRVYVPPCPGDAGLSVGAALQVAREAGCGSRRLPSPALGVGYSEDQIGEVLARCRPPRLEGVDDPASEAARRIARGEVVGWFQGRAELGPRALGNRSILADPRTSDMRERINARVKGREPFRPFAPAILAERAADYLVDPCDSPYMSFAFQVRPAWRDRLAAVTHVDGTARAQTVTEAENPVFHRLLRAVEREIGIPVVLNTSLNRSEEPIVNHPMEAVATFFATGMDALLLGPFLLTK